MMNRKQLACEPERIELFLRHELSGEEQAEFEAHLDECDDCCQRLEQSAAAEDVRDAIRESLQAERDCRDCDPCNGLGNSGDIEDRTSFSVDRVRELLAPTDDDRMMGRLGGYEVFGIIGTGGMGIVVKAFDPALNRYVAIKILSPHLGNSGAARKRFSREAQAAAAVVHDNVIEIHGVADARGLPYLVMPYVRGPSLQKRLDDNGPLSVVEILRIARQAAAGLAAAHAQGIVHRDVKPANILLAEGVDRVKLTDFGLARAADDASLTRTGVIAGTPQYMSPEQAQGELVDQRSDLFSLGSVMYAMCTGRPPFRAETSYGILRRITDTEPRPIREINPEMPEWLCKTIAKLMAKDPDDRFDSAEEVAALLEDYLAHVQRPATNALPLSLECQRKVKLFPSSSLRYSGVLVMTSVLATLLIGLAFLGVDDPQETGSEAKPEKEAVEPSPGTITDADRSDATAGMRVRVMLSCEMYSREMMQRLRANRLSIIGVGMRAIVDGKERTDFVGALAQDCALESFKKMNRADGQYWEALVIVPQTPTSDLSNRLLTQRRLDDVAKHGTKFSLEIYKGSRSYTTTAGADTVLGTVVQQSNKDARDVVETYARASVAGDILTAISLTDPGSAAEARQLSVELHTALGTKSVVIHRVLVSDEKRRALAVSAPVKLPQPNPDGHDSGRILFTLVQSDGGWRVKDIDFKSEAGATRQLESFKDAHHDAKETADDVPSKDASDAQQQNHQPARGG